MNMDTPASPLTLIGLASIIYKYKTDTIVYEHTYDYYSRLCLHEHTSGKATYLLDFTTLYLCKPTKRL